MEWGVYLSGGTLLALIMAAVKLTWQVRDIEKSIKAEIKKDVKGIVDELKAQVVDETKKREALREEVDGREETLRKEMGELGNALRQHIHQIETWSRDEFVRKESFGPVIGRLERGIEKIEEKMDRGFAGMMESVGKRLDQMVGLSKPAK